MIREDGLLIGLALFFIYKDITGMRKCCLLGTGISDYLDIPIKESNENKCINLIYEYLLEIRSQWDECNFEELRADSILYQELLKRRETQSEICSTCFHKEINSDQILYEFSKKLRNNLRRAEKKLAKIGRIDFIEESSYLAESALDELISLHSARWNSKNSAGVLNDTNIQAFHRDALMNLYNSNLMRIFSLKISGREIAAYYVFLHRGIAYAYIGGFDPEMVEYSPGAITLYYVIESINKRGFKQIDFLRGEEEYKRYWIVNERKNYKIRIVNK